MQERRKQARKGVAAGQGLTFFVQGKEERHIGIIDDVCDEGLGIAVEGCLAPGTMLEIIIEEDEQETYLVGEVKWCEPDEWLEGSFHMGVATRAKMVT
ncbi:MAG: PilZ domain-containing protein [Desulfobulbaceae bacterium]|nr:PilZ domain-containing protein [Desulfobulbaceae bacterium]